MNRIFALLGLVLAATFALASDGSQALMLGEQLSSSFRAASVEKTNAVFTDTAAVYWIHQKYAGMRQFNRYLEGQFLSSDYHVLTFDEQGSVEDETLSTSWGAFMFEYGKQDSPVSSRFVGRYTLIAQRLAGAWKIVSLHLSLPNPPDLPPVIK